MTTKQIGRCTDTGNGVHWDVFSDGKAYSDIGEVAYRWTNGTWNNSLTKISGDTVPWIVNVSDKLESIYKRFLSSIIVGPAERR